MKTIPPIVVDQKDFICNKEVHADLGRLEHYTKPPLGLTPWHIVRLDRIEDILAAIHRYVDFNYEIPSEWICELECLVEQHNTVLESESIKSYDSKSKT